MQTSDTRTTVESVDHSRVIFDFPQMPQVERLKEAIYYVSEKCQNDPGFGATKLNKELYFADLISFARFNEPITGGAYQHLPNGPAPVLLIQARGELVEEGYIRVEQRLYFTRRQSRTVPAKPYEFKHMTARDLRVMDEVIEALGNLDATQVSNLSHNTAWKMTQDGEMIPYNSVFLSDETVTAADIRAFTAESSQYHPESVA